MAWPEIVAGAGALVTFGLGLMGLFCPDAAAAVTSIEPVGRLGRSEIRATYGGLFATLGLFCLLTQAPTALTVVGLAWIGPAVGRLWSLLVDRSRSPKNLVGIGFEAGLGAAMLCPLWSAWVP